MRNVHGVYAPKSEPFGTRIEAFFIALCVAIGNLDGNVLCLQDSGLHGRSARYGHAQTGTATGVGLGASPWPLLFPAAKDTQFPHRPPELPKDQMQTKTGHRRTVHFGHSNRLIVSMSHPRN
jgi:hypothetical protein